MLDSAFEDNLNFLKRSSNFSLLRNIQRGLEKECLRVDEKGMLANTLHPECLGSSLTHPFITTDYSEALLEFITAPESILPKTFQSLTELHQYTYRCLQNEGKERRSGFEYLWAGSMPCLLPKEEDIPIAEYGRSNLGKLKNIYRRGLGYRYGKKMQTIAGIHYNFSFPTEFLKAYYREMHTKEDFDLFISEQYLGLIRNSLRWGFLLPLLFGSSPAICKGFIKDQQKVKYLENFKEETLLGPYATSLRLSDLGYSNTNKAIQDISYNSFPEFLSSMHHAVHTAEPRYTEIGILKEGEYLQLNDSILQIEDEHYAMVRPKRVARPEERTLAALKRAGIEYIEVRALDINPYLLLGIEPETVFILDAFLLTCFFLESKPITADEKSRIQDNLQAVVTDGRNPKLVLKDAINQAVPAVQLAQAFLDVMLKSAQYLDLAYESKDFTQACLKAKTKLNDMKSLPSARIVQDLSTNKLSHFEFIRKWSLKHRDTFLALPFSPEMVKYYADLALSSLLEQRKLEESDRTPFSEYLRGFLIP